MTRTGECLCRAVTLTADTMPSFQSCHCGMCRKWGAGPFMSAPCRSATFEGPVSRYQSSEHVERGFCATCGTHLFYHALTPDVYAVPVDLFDDDRDLPFKAEIYIDDKPERYSFADATKKLTGAEFAALFKKT